MVPAIIHALIKQGYALQSSTAKSGGYGSVFCMSNPDGTMCAVKVHRHPDTSTTGVPEDVIRGISINRMFGDSGFCPKFLGYYKHKNKYALISEYIPYTFNSELPKTHELQKTVDTLIINFLKQIAFMHANGMVHCDIKPPNTLFDSDLNVKIIDFDLTQYSQPRTSGTTGYTICYAPPEHTSGFTTKSDIWAAGATIYELLTGIEGIMPTYACKRSVYLSNALDSFDFLANIGTRGVSTKIEPVNCFRIKEMLRKMLQYYADNRPTAVQLLHDEYGIDYTPQFINTNVYHDIKCDEYRSDAIHSIYHYGFHNDLLAITIAYAITLYDQIRNTDFFDTYKNDNVVIAKMCCVVASKLSEDFGICYNDVKAPPRKALKIEYEMLGAINFKTWPINQYTRTIANTFNVHEDEHFVRTMCALLRETKIIDVEDIIYVPGME